MVGVPVDAIGAKGEDEIGVAGANGTDNAGGLGRAAPKSPVGEAPEDRRVGTKDAARLGEFTFAGAGERILTRAASIVAGATFATRGAVHKAGPAGTCGERDQAAESVGLVVRVRNKGKERRDFLVSVFRLIFILERMTGGSRPAPGS